MPTIATVDDVSVVVDGQSYIHLLDVMRILGDTDKNAPGRGTHMAYHYHVCPCIWDTLCHATVMLAR